MRRLDCKTLVMFALAGVVPAYAKDLCFGLNAATGGVTYALKAFSPPPRDKCKPIMGFTTVAGWILTGTACTKADGSTMRFGITAQPALNEPRAFHATLPPGTPRDRHTSAFTSRPRSRWIDPSPRVENPSRDTVHLKSRTFEDTSLDC